MKSMASCLKTNKKLTNHSMRKTLVSKRKNSVQSRNVICEITGHAREASFDDYDEINENQRTELICIISGYKEVQNQNVQTRSPTKPVQMSPQIKRLQSNANELHWLRFITSNKRAKFIRQWWTSILVFCRLDVRDFPQAFRRSSSTAWQPSLPLAASFHHRVTLVARSISTPKTPVRSQNHGRNEGLT